MENIIYTYMQIPNNNFLKIEVLHFSPKIIFFFFAEFSFRFLPHTYINPQYGSFPSFYRLLYNIHSKLSLAHAKRQKLVLPVPCVIPHNSQEKYGIV